MIQELIQTSGAIEYTKQFAKKEIALAKQALTKLKASPYRTALEGLTEFALTRDH